MRVAVTGAGGFLGTHVVDTLRRRDHLVIAFVRPAASGFPQHWDQDVTVDVVRHDLREPRSLPEALRGADAVIHLAAAKRGDFYAQFASTVIGTEHLLDAMAQVGVRRLVLVSSFSVYDYARLSSGELLDESAPVGGDASTRDVYAQTKMLQEALVRDAARDGSVDATVVRPGLVYGAGNLWNPCLGVAFGKTFVRVGGAGQMPLTFVENCAEAIVAATERAEAVGEVINVVDDDLPSRRAFARVLKRRDPTAPRVIAVSWPVARAVAASAWSVNMRLLGGKARLPSFLVPAQLAARFAPLRWSNEHAKRTLSWAPRYGFEDAVDRTLGAGRQAVS